LKACLEPLIYRLRKPYFESKTESEACASGQEPSAVRTGQFFLSEKYSGNFCRAVRTGKSFLPVGGRPDASSGRPDSQLTTFFVSFPM